MEEKTITMKQALGAAVLSVVINSFTSTFLAMIVKTGMDSSIVTCYRLLFVSLVMLPWAFSRQSYRDNMKTAPFHIWKLFIFYSFTKFGGLPLSLLQGNNITSFLSRNPDLPDRRDHYRY